MIFLKISTRKSTMRIAQKKRIWKNFWILKCNDIRFWKDLTTHWRIFFRFWNISNRHCVKKSYDFRRRISKIKIKNSNQYRKFVIRTQKKRKNKNSWNRIQKKRRKKRISKNVKTKSTYVESKIRFFSIFSIFFLFFECFFLFSIDDENYFCIYSNHLNFDFELLSNIEFLNAIVETKTNRCRILRRRRRCRWNRCRDRRRCRFDFRFEFRNV